MNNTKTLEPTSLSPQSRQEVINRWIGPRSEDAELLHTLTQAQNSDLEIVSVYGILYTNVQSDDEVGYEMISIGKCYIIIEYLGSIIPRCIYFLLQVADWITWSNLLMH